MTRILLLATLFLLVGVAIGLLISARQRKAATRRPPPAVPRAPSDPWRERLIRRLIGGILLLAAALIAIGYAYYSD